MPPIPAGILAQCHSARTFLAEQKNAARSLHGHAHALVSENGRARTKQSMPGLSEARESIALSLRKTLYLPLDDRLYISRACIHAEGAHTGLARQRHGALGIAVGRCGKFIADTLHPG